MKLLGDAAVLFVVLLMAFMATLAVLDIGRALGEAARAIL